MIFLKALCLSILSIDILSSSSYISIDYIRCMIVEDIFISRLEISIILLKAFSLIQFTIPSKVYGFPAPTFPKNGYLPIII